MKMPYLTIFAALAASFCLLCAELAAPREAAAAGKTLVVYFSMPETDDPEGMTREEDNSAVVIDGRVLGNTQYAAGLIAERTGADIFRIEPATPYPTDHETLVDLAREEQDDGARPALKNGAPDLAQYDTIFVGYPNWWGDMPMILYTFLESADMSGKRVVAFVTHGGSGFSRTVETIAKLQPGARVERGVSISRNDAQECEPEITAWLREAGFAKEGNAGKKLVRAAKAVRRIRKAAVRPGRRPAFFYSL